MKYLNRIRGELREGVHRRKGVLRNPERDAYLVVRLLETNGQVVPDRNRSRPVNGEVLRDIISNRIREAWHRNYCFRQIFHLAQQCYTKPPF